MKKQTRGKLSTQFVVFFVAIIITIFSAFAFLLARMHQDIVTDAREELEIISILYEHRMNTFLDDALARFSEDVIEAFDAIGNGQTPSMHTDALSPVWMVTRTDGVVVYSSSKERIGTVIDLSYRTRDDQFFLTVQEVKNNTAEADITAAIGDSGFYLVSEVDLTEILTLAENFTTISPTAEMIIVGLNADGGIQTIFPTFITGDYESYSFESLEEKQESAAMQALTGIEAGSSALYDYRGERVVAATRFIDSMSWGLVLKRDYAFVIAPIYEIAFYISVAMVLILLLLILFI